MSMFGRRRAVRLTTYRRSGEPVSTPVWFAEDGPGVVYVLTTASSGKVQRLRGNPRVALAACTQRGRVTGPSVAGTARLLDEDEAKTVLPLVRRRRFGLLGRLLEGERSVIARIEVDAPGA